MRIIRTLTETILDGSGELTFTRNDAALSCDGVRDEGREVLRIQHFTTYAYYSGLRARLRLCWVLWQWLGREQ